ncbi:MAG: hypothetical protein H0X24_02110 [Ktedonobacterales bacterium]|nr:hypothetical protein [Ktedonobacterales bacterium]
MTPLHAIDAAAPPVGLTGAEAAGRMRQGLGNTLPTKTTRTSLQIARENVFTFFTVVLWGLSITLIIMGRASDAFAAACVLYQQSMPATPPRRVAPSPGTGAMPAWLARARSGIPRV